MVTSEKRTILVVAAEKFELQHIRPRTDASWRFVANGPGPVLAGSGMDRVGSDVSAVVSVGLCGALATDLKIGEIVIGSEVNGVPIDRPTSSLAHKVGPIVSVDRVVQTVEDRRSLRRSGAIAVEMESAAVMERARRWGVPFYCVRAVSDVADESFSIDLNAARGADGRFRIARILMQAARRPFTGIPELLRLKRHSEAASIALGEFIADCSF